MHELLTAPALQGSSQRFKKRKKTIGHFYVLNPMPISLLVNLNVVIEANGQGGSKKGSSSLARLLQSKPQPNPCIKSPVWLPCLRFDATIL